MNKNHWLLSLSFVFISFSLIAQDSSITQSPPQKIIPKEGLDFIDVARSIFHKHPSPRTDTTDNKTGKFHTSVLPSVQYTLQTGFAVAVNANTAFYTSNHEDANISSVALSVNYTQKHQFFIPIQGNFWTPGNKINILTDWHYEKYPQQTFGLGGYTTSADGYNIDYNYVRLYQAFMKTISPDFFIGAGYDLDYYWNVSEVDPPAGVLTDFQKYGLTNRSVSSGITLNVLYDRRRNSLNPKPGYYANIVLRNNFTFLGSDVNWQSLLIDARKYIHFPATSPNTLAFWTYDWFTVSGKPPYLNLANTACDTYLNMGRGYIQARFRGQNLVYFESEYRFKILNNGLIGGVAFLNAQSYTEQESKRFEVVSPGYGVGLRFKFNKFSNTNIALDYGWGSHGSQGIFANLGEVF